MKLQFLRRYKFYLNRFPHPESRTWIVKCIPSDESLLRLVCASSWSLAHLTVCYAELGEIKQAQATVGKLKANWPGLDLDDIIDYELDFFEDPAICSRYRAILHRVDKNKLHRCSGPRWPVGLRQVQLRKVQA